MFVCKVTEMAFFTEDFQVFSYCQRNVPTKSPIQFQNFNLFSESLQNHIHIFKLLMFDMQYWKYNNICSSWKVKEKLKI